MNAAQNNLHLLAHGMQKSLQQKGEKRHSCIHVCSCARGRKREKKRRKTANWDCPRGVFPYCIKATGVVCEISQKIAQSHKNCAVCLVVLTKTARFAVCSLDLCQIAQNES
ncbi:MAG: hypothetical protein ACI4PM_05605 [Butyricicoccus sp.]